MVCSPEQARLNGAKSKGPKTEQGKAIAASNATKHGLLAKQPPLLVTEDLATFEGLIQGLIDQYQPDNPVEHFLVQQVAMAIVRQHRLWKVEVAIANAEMLKAQQRARFPDQITLPEGHTNMLSKRTPFSAVLSEEKVLLMKLICDVQYGLSEGLEKGKSDAIDSLRGSLNLNNRSAHLSAAVRECCGSLARWLDESWDGRRKRFLPDFQETKSRLAELLKLICQRIGEVEQTIADSRQLNLDIEQAEMKSHGVQQPEMFSRYQRSISRDLYDALDRLAAIQQRKSNGSMGSFGQNALGAEKP